MQLRPGEGFRILVCKRADGRADIPRKPFSLTRLRRPIKHIPPERRCQRAIVWGRKGVPILRLPIVERGADPAHFLRYGQIADAHFAHAGVHVAAEQVEYRLAQTAQVGGLPFQAAKKQHGMQCDHLKTPVNRIRTP